MDLVYYSGQPPGKYPKRHRVGPELFEWRDDKFLPGVSAMATTRKGGRGRCWAEWAELWSAAAEWVYDTVSANEERASVPVGAKVPRRFLATDAIDAADAVRDAFAQLAENPIKFQGIEWDFLELEAGREVMGRFHARFGRRDPDAKKNVESLARRAGLEGWNRLNYEEVSPVALKKCPDTFKGLDWESWMLSVQGGDVAVVDTLFQALWAVIMLSLLPVKIDIVDKDDRFPRHRDPDTVYL
ncbi:hypothetical protein LY78DRAFT_720836 [Colletotrichum sublineola]|nr:hypothetical protein LY78DRAFT_720836 [Colletotrichum sublineola]